MNLQTISSKKRPTTTTGWSAVPSALWWHLGLPEGECRAQEWINPTQANAVILRTLYRICRFDGWPKATLSYLLNPQDGTLTPEILVRMPAVRAMIRVKTKWRFAYKQLHALACQMESASDSVVYRISGGYTFDSDNEYHRLRVMYARSLLKSHIERLLQQYAAYSVRREAMEMYKEGSSFIPSAWDGQGLSSRLDQLIDHVDEMERTWGKVNIPRGQYRRLDKIARKMDRKTLKSEYREDYDLGKALAPYYGTIIEHLEEKAQEHNIPIFVHGRDGEIVYMLLKEKGIPAAYAVTSRNLTTSCSDLGIEDYEKIMEYFRRVVPQRAWHYDTGFIGSIPRWFQQKGWDVVGISLASSDNREYQIPGLEDLNKGTSYRELKHKTLREVVLDYMEHQPQRLEKAYKLAFEYNSDCPKFWARLAGIRSGLKKWESRFSTSGTFQVTLGDFLKKPETKKAEPPPFVLTENAKMVCKSCGDMLSVAEVHNGTGYCYTCDAIEEYQSEEDSKPLSFFNKWKQGDLDSMLLIGTLSDELAKKLVKENGWNVVNSQPKCGEDETIKIHLTDPVNHLHEVWTTVDGLVASNGDETYFSKKYEQMNDDHIHGVTIKDLANDNGPIYDFAAKWQGSYSHAIQRATRLSWGVLKVTIQDYAMYGMEWKNLHTTINVVDGNSVAIELWSGTTLVSRWAINEDGTMAWVSDRKVYISGCPSCDPTEIPF